MLVLGSCTDNDRTEGGAVRTIDVDGGDSTVVFVDERSVEARAGDTVRIHHAGKPTPQAEVGVTHAFVAAPPDALPPIFLGGPEGLVPNPAVWGACRGGEPSAQISSCPTLPTEAPDTWDGAQYWSLGAMVPGEDRDIPLADDLADGKYVFFCVFHAGLSVAIDVTSEPAEPSPHDLPDPADVAGDAPEPSDSHRVFAGFTSEMAPASVNLFSPEEVRIEVGERVTWDVTSRDPHDVVFADHPVELVDSSPVDSVPTAPKGAWDGASDIWSGFLSTEGSAVGDSFSLTFGAPGTYGYTCRFHPGMEGVVVVEPKV